MARALPGRPSVRLRLLGDDALDAVENRVQASASSILDIDILGHLIDGNLECIEAVVHDPCRIESGDAQVGADECVDAVLVRPSEAPTGVLVQQGFVVVVEVLDQRVQPERGQQGIEGGPDP